MPNPERSAAYQRFLKSLNIGLEEWREGIGYDLEALAEITPEERTAAVDLLRERLATRGDWRDVEALAAIGTPEAREVIRAARNHPNHQVQLRAAECLEAAGEDGQIEDHIIAALRGSELYYGLSQAIDLAEEHPTPRVQQTLRHVALNGRTPEARVNCAGLALYLGGQADEAFDWNHRPFFLRFGDEDRAVRLEAYRELCKRIGVQPAADA
jgi:hypothetical protein